jgi:hypothetical protein
MTEGHPLASVSGTVIDLRGLYGDAAFVLLRFYSDRRLIIQDLPLVIVNVMQK